MNPKKEQNVSSSTNQTRRKRSPQNNNPEAVLSTNRGAFLGFLMKRLKDRSDAEDVLQDFCMRVLARKDQLREVDRMDAWLYAVLRSALNDHYRKLPCNMGCYQGQITKKSSKLVHW